MIEQVNETINNSNNSPSLSSLAPSITRHDMKGPPPASGIVLSDALNSL